MGLSHSIIFFHKKRLRRFFTGIHSCVCVYSQVHIGPDDWMSESALHSKKPWRAVLARRRWRSGYNAGGSPQYIGTVKAFN